MSAPINKTTQELIGQALEAMRSNQFSQAANICDEVLSKEPNHIQANAIQFSGLFKDKQFERARQMGGVAAELNPKSVFILNNQACLQLEAKQPAAASGLLKSLIDEYGENAQWLYNLALAQRMVANYEHAITIFRSTLDHDPEHDKAAFQLADCLSQVGHREDAVKAFDYVRLLRSKHAPSHSHYVHEAILVDAITLRGLKQEMDLWAARFIPKSEPYPIESINSLEPIRFGFIINELPEHYLEAMVLPVLNVLSIQDNVTIYWQSEHDAPTNIDNSIRLSNTHNLSDADFARQVRSDEIHIIVDLCGMQKGNRQRALGLQLASKQFAWLGHDGAFATSNIQAIEPRLGNLPYAFAPYTENRVRDKAPDKTLIGIGTRNGLSDKMVKTWAFILDQLPDWNLSLEAKNNEVKNLLLQRFALLGVDKNRLIFESRPAFTPDQIVLDNYHDSDLIAAYEALTSQASLVTMSGRHFPGQRSARLLKHVSPKAAVAKAQYRYTQIAIKLANENSRMSSVTTKQIKKSSIANMGKFAKLFRKALLA